MTALAPSGQCSEATAAADAFMGELYWAILGLDDEFITDGLDPKMMDYILRIAKVNPGIRPALAKASAFRRTAQPRTPRRQSSAIYFVRAGRAGHIKIGSASDVVARIKMLQTGCPDELQLLGAMAGNAAMERRLHEQFAHLRVRGEWFEATDELLRFIQEMTR